MNKYIFYRITSKVNDKPRLENFSKLDYLDNLQKIFSEYKIVCIADNCDEEIFEILKRKNFYKLVRTNYGNSKSFKYLLAAEVFAVADEDLVYFVEDDYAHLSNADKILEEGLLYFDYVTLYDHPDKYGTYPLKINPLVPFGKLSEVTQIIKGTHVLWRTTNSTTMTFACYAKTIKEDINVWKFFSSITKIPRDFYIWLILLCPQSNIFAPTLNISIVLLAANLRSIFKSKRKLGVSIPSASSHMEFGMVPDNFKIQSKIENES